MAVKRIIVGLLLLLVCGQTSGEPQGEPYLREHIYKPAYRRLTPGVYLVNETVLNPQLRDSAVWRKRAEHLNVSVFNRYVLTALEKRRRYVFSISFMGSPLAKYVVSFRYVSRDVVAGKFHTTEGISNSSILTPQDMEFVVFSTSDDSNNSFSPRERVSYDALTNRTLHELEIDLASHSNNVLPVIEVFPVVAGSAVTFAADGTPVLPFYHYNVQLDSFTANILPIKYIPLAVSIFVAALGGIRLYRVVAGMLLLD
ncbi:hypothetical protein, conserved [Angomonas deanei]|uniref:Uncharacterized protein n=1 Tax=Angomonas deanei TaxID=59799 RepID=A0A7G2CRP3_9TRYP|nr:hypothetical protein, conserved [Angomonas deanei]